MPKVFFRCNSGHYFSTIYCPLDGWTWPGPKPDFSDIQAIAERLSNQGKEVTIDILRENNVSKEVLRRVLLIEFGDPSASFDGFVPEIYIVEGHIQRPPNIDQRFF